MGSDARETDRGTWWLVAQRDFWYRLRDKGFVISSGITLAVLTGLILINAYAGSGTPTFDLGLLGQGSGRLGPLVVQAGDAQGTVVHTRPVADRDAADAALADGSLDAVLVDGKSLLAEREVPSELQSAVQTAVVADGIRTTLEANDVPADEIAQILNPAPVPVETLEPQDPNRETNSTVAFIAVVILYGQLFGYGVWVATGVIEEKASRVVEILLSTIRARQLLAGKILGIGTLGLLQLIVIATYSIVLASLTGALDFPAHALGTAALAIGWFMLGFAFYASLFAVAGVARLAHGGAAERHRAAQPGDPGVVLPGDRRHQRSHLHALADRVDRAVLVRAGDARADLARRGHAVRGRRGARRVDRIDGAADPARRPGLLGSGAAHGRPREAPRRLALGVQLGPS